ncbi:small basic family protein [Candidatus Peregrinibacteria bacterium]|jgi:small basic protein|nr:small basic family protein [Candidatus Peregrinibacteria bacterium]MBT7736895.1 small basic family protein [Candidatus Peregrinibacteria bacterium]
MQWAILGLITGIIIGLLTSFTIPIEYIKYTAVIIIGILDSLFGAIRAEIEKREYDQSILLSGLFLNITLAFGFTFLGERLGLDLFLAVSVVFIFRIFTNLGKIRRAVLLKMLHRKLK